jgi:hypothetical protein
MSEVELGSPGGQPVDGGSERFPELLLIDCLLPINIFDHAQLAHTVAFGRPPSLSIQSVASSSEHSTWSSDKDATLDSRRSSVISSASSFGCQAPFATQHQPELSQSQFQCHSPRQQQQQQLTRSRRDAKQLHAVRLQRAGSTSLALASKKEGNGGSKNRRFKRASSNPADALAATEPPHEQGLTRSAGSLSSKRPSPNGSIPSWRPGSWKSRTWCRILATA